MRIDPKKETLGPIIYYNTTTLEKTIDDGKLNYFVLFINESRQIDMLLERLKRQMTNFGTYEEECAYTRTKIEGTSWHYQLVTFVSNKKPSEIRNLYQSQKGKIKNNEDLYFRKNTFLLEEYVDNFVAQMKRE